MTSRVKNPNSDLLTSPCIVVSLEWKIILLPVYVLHPMDLDLTLDPNDPDEPYVLFISTASLFKCFHD